MNLFLGVFRNLKKMRVDRQRKAMESYGNTLRNVVTTKDQRVEAIEMLEQAEPEIAIPQLLARFEITIDHGIQDTREKERIAKTIFANPEISKPYVIDLFTKGRRISWLIKLAEKLFTREQFLELLLEHLKVDMAHFDDIQLEKNTEILLSLRDIPDQRIVEAAKIFIGNRDEGLRMAALECIESQALHFEEARSFILELTKQGATDDNSRFLGVVNSMIQKHGWK